MFYLYNPMMPITTNITIHSYLGFATIVFKDFFHFE
ncbi:hypothetical protein J2Z40_001021 [Cytobacillus eiseniae]|uniref:Uncharacterized protein n=1 Tax=Cytobacillus eiseniae TaxID=762947 RepID=A0ABS4RC42_9BACI|nr:hypothetical protein [Cytobacillus eiseniae]